MRVAVLRKRRTQYANELAQGDQDWVFENRFENKKLEKPKKKSKSPKKKSIPVPDFLDRWSSTPKRSRKRTKKMIEGAEQAENPVFKDVPKKRRKKK